MNKLKFIDLFSGIGGFRIALEQNGAQCVFSSEIDPYAAKTYFDNFNEMPSGDITKIETSKIPDHNILCAGFPCQPFSLAGKRLGFEDTRGTLFFDVARIIEAKKPEAVILENVSGITNHNGGKTLQVIENTLTDLGYKITWKLLNSKDFGVPQNRNRWYCVAIRNDIEVDISKIFPEKQELKTTLDKIIDWNLKESHEISDIALKNIKLHIDKYVGKNNSKIKNEPIIANNIRPSKVLFSSSGVSPCLTAKMGTGGNNVPVIYDLKRKLTVKECLALMGFPENFKIKENYSQSYKQLGNSVVVPVLSMIAQNVIHVLKRK
ncbi:DNA cytosine methyltransferase [Mycoplasma sp. Ms02]|uniref:DNA cytosine methyltransferase n=1 Tax=Mycoplasma sp. Ms02 TaxID=353851 RepID=UPI001C8AF4C6|nr:DNA (cytosine-5-)-methyltransferase [Mycoplasma sp. Ms02]QZE12231.1 DNA (cytosine-5-)-methyltransferase [Mycoplasma sp. Ms02]